MLSLCEAIAIEVEEYSNQPSEILEYLDDQYAVSTEETAIKLLQQATNTKLSDFKTVIEYINRYREIKSNLRQVNYTYLDSQMVANILMGLPNSYWSFRKMWNYNRIKHPGKAINIHSFTKLLQAEEEQKNIGGQARTNNSRGSTQATSRKKAQNATKKCTHPGCPNPEGHLTENYWTAHPEKKP